MKTKKSRSAPYLICSKHRSYRARAVPRTECAACWAAWDFEFQQARRLALEAQFKAGLL